MTIMEFVLDVIKYEFAKIGLELIIGIPLAVIGMGIIYYYMNRTKGSKKGK